MEKSDTSHTIKPVMLLDRTGNLSSQSGPKKLKLMQLTNYWTNYWVILKLALSNLKLRFREAITDKEFEGKVLVKCLPTLKSKSPK